MNRDESAPVGKLDISSPARFSPTTGNLCQDKQGSTSVCVKHPSFTCSHESSACVVPVLVEQTGETGFRTTALQETGVS